jgi:hypothetical protein
MRERKEKESLKNPFFGQKFHVRKWVATVFAVNACVFVCLFACLRVAENFQFADTHSLVRWLHLLASFLASFLSLFQRASRN